MSESHEETEPSWSSNGRQIAFISTQGFGKRLGVLDLTSGRINYVTRTSKRFARRPNGTPRARDWPF